MQLKRLFSTNDAKGNRNYLNTQKKYEIIRTVLYFAVSLSLFAAGYLQTKDKANLLTIVAVLGCLPASKSAISAIMFLRFSGCSSRTADEIERHSEGLNCLYDMVFTSYQQNFVVSHLTVRGSTICGFSESKKWNEMEEKYSNAFYKHIGDLLKLDGHQGITVKIFTNLNKYTERLDQMKSLGAEEDRTLSIIGTLKSVAL